jgi:hypothetical protein
MSLRELGNGETSRTFRRLLLQSDDVKDGQIRRMSLPPGMHFGQLTQMRDFGGLIMAETYDAPGSITPMHMRTAGTNASRSAEQNPSWRTVEYLRSGSSIFSPRRMTLKLVVSSPVSEAIN